MRRTRFNQSSPVHPLSESRGGYPERDIGVVVVVAEFDQSSPVHPVSESRGGTLSVTYAHTHIRTHTHTHGNPRV